MGSSEKKRILIVDDEEDIAKVVEMELSEAGFEVFYARNGREGLQKAKKMKFDLILLDVIMEEMDGFQVLEALKQDKKLMNIPVIMLTGRDAPEDIERGIGNLADKYLTKPFNLLTLLSEVNKTLGILR